MRIDTGEITVTNLSCPPNVFLRVGTEAEGTTLTCETVGGVTVGSVTVSVAAGIETGTFSAAEGFPLETTNELLDLRH